MFHLKKAEIRRGGKYIQCYRLIGISQQKNILLLSKGIKVLFKTYWGNLGPCE
jgi:hypothetical protein